MPRRSSKSEGGQQGTPGLPPEIAKRFRGLSPGNALHFTGPGGLHVRPPLTERSARHKAWAGPPQAETYVAGPNMIRRSRVADGGRQSTERR